MLVFPSDQFHQEPLEGQAAEFQKFCEEGLGGQLPPGVRLMEPVRVNGPETHPVWAFLKASEANNMREPRWNAYFQRGFEDGSPGGRLVPWNWSFFVVGRDGQVMERLDACQGILEQADQCMHALRVADEPEVVNEGVAVLQGALQQLEGHVVLAQTQLEQVDALVEQELERRRIEEEALRRERQALLDRVATQMETVTEQASRVQEVYAEAEESIRDTRWEEVATAWQEVSSQRESYGKISASVIEALSAMSEETVTQDNVANMRKTHRTA